METEAEIISLEAKYGKKADIVLVYSYKIDGNILNNKKESKRKIR